MRTDSRRGEVWRVDLEPTVGDDRYRNAPWMVPLDPDPASGLTKPPAADTFQFRFLSTLCPVERIGTLTEDALDAIAAGVALCVRHKAR